MTLSNVVKLLMQLKVLFKISPVYNVSLQYYIIHTLVNGVYYLNILNPNHICRGCRKSLVICVLILSLFVLFFNH